MSNDIYGNKFDVLEDGSTGLFYVRANGRLKFHSRDAACMHRSRLKQMADNAKTQEAQRYIQPIVCGSVLYGVAKDGYWGYEHPDFEISDWVDEVQNHATMLSYHQWVTCRIEQAQDEEDDRKSRTA